VYTLVDLLRKKKVKNLTIGVWALIIVFGQILGSVLYLLVGRADDGQEEN
jgi:hypothetical protein